MRRFALLIAVLTLLAGVAATVSGGATQAQARWVITDLGTLGGEDSEAIAINNRGQIVGKSDTASGRWHAFLWENGKMRDLGTLPAKRYSVATAINDRGQVVGHSSTGWDWKFEREVWQRAFLWQKGKMQDLGTLGGKRSREAHAVAINEHGQITGSSETRATDKYGLQVWHAFLWQRGKMIDLGSLGGRITKPYAINDRGQIVGVSDTKTDTRHAFLWERGRLRDLGTLFDEEDSTALAINERGQIVGGSGDYAFLWEKRRMTDLGALSSIKRSEVAAINERGQIVGGSYMEAIDRPGLIEHAFLWEKGKMRDLGTLRGEDSKAVAINEAGQIVGWAGIGARPRHASLWVNGRMTDLVPGGKESVAVAINNRGQIIGWSTTKNGVQHAVLWTLKR